MYSEDIRKVEMKAYSPDDYYDKSLLTYYSRKIQHFNIHQAFRMLNESLQRKRTLVICCGSGVELTYCKRKQAEVVGVDISKPMLIHCQKRFLRKIQLLQADAQNLPFVDRSFELGLVCLGLHHLPNPYEGIEQLLGASKNVVIIDLMKPLVTKLVTKFGFYTREWSGITPNRLENYRVIALFKKYKAKVRSTAYFDHIPQILERFLKYQIATKFLSSAFKVQINIVSKLKMLQIFLGNLGIFITAT